MRVLLALPVLAILLPLSASAGDPGTSSMPYVPEEPVLQGYVCAGNGTMGCRSPVEGATVTLTGEGLSLTTTAPHGHFAFDVGPGTYLLRAERPGFLASETTVEAYPGSWVEVMLPPTRTEVGVSVVDPAGRPVAGARVFVHDALQATTVVTGADGKARLATWTGMLELHAVADGWLSVRSSTFLDGTNEPASLRMLAIPPTEGTVRGVVRDQRGDAVPNATVLIEMWQAFERLLGPGHNADTYIEARTDASGAYSAGIYVGEAWFAVEPGGFGDVRNLTAGDNVVDLTVFLVPEPTAELRVTFLDAGTGLQAPARPVVLRYLDVPYVACTAASAPEEAPWEACALQANGSVVHGLVVPGHAILSVNDGCWPEGDWGDPGAPGDCTQHRHVQTVALVSGRNELTVRLHAVAAPPLTLSGTVRGPDGTVDGWVRVAPVDGLAPGIHAAGPVTDGSFRLAVHPGLYQVEVQAHGHLPSIATVHVTADLALDVQLEEGSGCGPWGCCPGCDGGPRPVPTTWPPAEDGGAVPGTDPTEVPVFPTWWAGALAVALAVGGMMWMRRKPA